LPEGSSLTLVDGKITASDLKTALREVDLRVAFLSCCLGARSAAEVKRGDFHGFFHALSESGVPTTIGYRWDVEDESALCIASDFYQVLFRDFCPGRALLRSRQNRSVVSAQKRDDPSWASPVLLMEM
jgi:CHAT domain-containing protein